MNSCVVILPAAGCGERLTSNVPKQFCLLFGRPILSYTLECFEKIYWIDDIIITVQEADIATVRNLLKLHGHTKFRVTCGGATRHRSIYLGIKEIKDTMCAKDCIVIIHDAVRPFVEEEFLDKLIKAALQYGACGAVRPLVSTVVAANDQGFLHQSLDRVKYKNSETPQAYRYEIISAAYNKCSDYDLCIGTECLDLVKRYCNVNAKLIEGPEDLWKVTYRKDLFAAAGIIEERTSVVILLNCSLDIKKYREAFDEKNIKAVDYSSEIMHLMSGQSAFNVAVVHHSFSQFTTTSFVMVTEEIVKRLQTRNVGAVIHVVLADDGSGSSNEKPDRSGLKGKFRELSLELKPRKICLNIVYVESRSGEGSLTDTEALVTNLASDRNLNYSGQTFSV